MLILDIGCAILPPGEVEMVPQCVARPFLVVFATVTEARSHAVRVLVFTT